MTSPEKGIVITVKLFEKQCTDNDLYDQSFHLGYYLEVNMFDRVLLRSETTCIKDATKADLHMEGTFEALRLRDIFIRQAGIPLQLIDTANDIEP